MKRQNILPNYARTTKQLANLFADYPGEDIKDVILDYRNTYNLSWADIAVICNYSKTGFLKLRKALGIKDNRRIYATIHSHSKEAMDRKATLIGYDSIEHAVVSLRLLDQTYEQVATKLGISIRTAWKYCPLYLRTWI